MATIMGMNPPRNKSDFGRVRRKKRLAYYNPINAVNHILRVILTT
jgi:hypothetical protein